MGKQIYYQITVHGPSRLINGPHQGSYQHSVVACAYVNRYPGSVETLRERAYKALEAKYSSDISREAIDSCAFELSKAVLEPDEATKPEVKTFHSFADLCNEIFLYLKAKRLEAEKEELQNKLLKVDTELAARIRKVDEELAEIRKQ